MPTYWLNCLKLKTNFTRLKTSRTPVNKLNCAFCLDLSNGGVDIFWYDVASVQETTSHVLSMSRIALFKNKALKCSKLAPLTLTIWFWGSKQAAVISATLSCSCNALLREIIGAYVARGKWMRGYGTKLVWNSWRSTLSAPSKRSEAVIDETIWPIIWFRLLYDGRSTPKFRLQMS